MRPLVLDTNIVLDLFVFDDAQSRPLKAGLERGDWGWVATQAMRDELERVLDYPHICSRLAFSRLAAADVLAGFDRHARIVEAPCTAGVSCSDPDDQKFIECAAAGAADLLVTKDRALLRVRGLPFRILTPDAFGELVSAKRP
jgi:putative PIN family toxin of toxin-antitoxin system